MVRAIIVVHSLALQTAVNSRWRPNTVALVFGLWTLVFGLWSLGFGFGAFDFRSVSVLRDSPRPRRSLRLLRLCPSASCGWLLYIEIYRRAAETAEIARRFQIRTPRNSRRPVEPEAVGAD